MQMIHDELPGTTFSNHDQSENIDVKATMKKKLDKDMPAYRILSACDPSMAWEAIGVGSWVGAILSEVINAIGRLNRPATNN